MEAYRKRNGLHSQCFNRRQDTSVYSNGSERNRTRQARLSTESTGSVWELVQLNQVADTRTETETVTETGTGTGQKQGQRQCKNVAQRQKDEGIWELDQEQ